MRRLMLAALLSMMSLPVLAAELTMFKNPSCGCCQGWADYMVKAGWTAKVVATDDMDTVKRQFGVPARMESCHTAIVDGYVIEGHVPAEAIAKLLKDRPKATGLAAPGMPQGSPGMSGAKEPFTVFLFGPDGAQPFMKF